MVVIADGHPRRGHVARQPISPNPALRQASNSVNAWHRDMRRIVRGIHDGTLMDLATLG